MVKFLHHIDNYKKTHLDKKYSLKYRIYDRIDIN